MATLYAPYNISQIVRHKGWTLDYYKLKFGVDWAGINLISSRNITLNDNNSVYFNTANSMLSYNGYNHFNKVGIEDYISGNYEYWKWYYPDPNTPPDDNGYRVKNVVGNINSIIYIPIDHFPLSYSSNYGGVYQIYSTNSWITATIVDGMITLNVSKNVSSELRYGYLYAYFISQDGNNRRQFSIYVKQSSMNNSQPPINDTGSPSSPAPKVDPADPGTDPGEYVYPSFAWYVAPTQGVNNIPTKFDADESHQISQAPPTQWTFTVGGDSQLDTLSKIEGMGAADMDILVVKSYYIERDNIASNGAGRVVIELNPNNSSQQNTDTDAILIKAVTPTNSTTLRIAKTVTIPV